MASEENDLYLIETSEASNTEDSQETIDEASVMKAFGEVLGDTISKSMNEMAREQIKKNVAIYMDYDNVYWTLKKKYGHDPDNSDPAKNIFLRLWEIYGQDNIRTFRAYADFEKVATNLTSLQKKRVQIRHVYSNDKSGDIRKNASDIELCIDLIESTYKDSSITCYVVVTADSDMIPILSRLMYKGKRVELYYLSSAMPEHIDMTSFAHHSVDLLDFLEVEIPDENVHDYINDALDFIDRWEKTATSERWLGAGWLKGQLVEKLKITDETASKLIEYLQTNDIIANTSRQTSFGVKQSISITDAGQQLFAGLQEAAASKK